MFYLSLRCVLLLYCFFVLLESYKLFFLPYRRLKPDLAETAALIVGEELSQAEAAEVLGVSPGTVAWRMSEVKKALAALAVLIFTFIWNDYFWAVVLTQGEAAQPVTAGITSFNAQFRAMYHLMSAGSIIAALPPVAMFFLMQKHFIAGLTLGAVK